MGKKTKVNTPAPDPAIGQAALIQAELGMEYLDVAKDQFNQYMERQKPIDEITAKVGASQLAAQEQASQWATEDRERYKTIFQPMQDQFIRDAQNWDTPERQNKMAAEARADVMNNASMQREIRGRQMASMGIDPTSGRYEGIERSADIATSLSAAGAENTARNTVRNQALALRGDAINMGNGLPSQAAGSLGLGVSSGGAAVGTSMAGNQSFLAGTGALQSGYQTAMGGQQSRANILQNQHNSQLQAWSMGQQANAQNSAGLWSGLGSMVGMAALFPPSSRELKEDMKPVKGALEAIENLPVEEWKYKDGVADGGKHIGTYAEDFQRETGKGDGKTLPVVDAIGVTMGAVKELSANVKKLEKSIGKRPRGARREA